MSLPLLIETRAEELKDGLFGDIFYKLFQVLPYLDSRDLRPHWHICSTLYGREGDQLTVPGVLDLAYTPTPGPAERIPLFDLRRQRGSILGNDWHALSQLWNTFFRVPDRILAQAEGVLPAGKRILALHYRGNDKLTTSEDSNHVSHESFLTMVTDFLEHQPPFDLIFAATDEFLFLEKLRRSIPLPVINLGEVGFHKDMSAPVSLPEKADRALLDVVLLSRCTALILTSSALSGFAKVLNPDLSIFRTAASKLFQEFPYFPVAFVPVLPVQSPLAQELLTRAMDDDWTADPAMQRFRSTFSALPRHPLRQFTIRLIDALGFRTFVHSVVRLSGDRARVQLRRDRARIAARKASQAAALAGAQAAAQPASTAASAAPQRSNVA